ncbi:MAG: protein kinase [Bacteroidota bacterium]
MAKIGKYEIIEELGRGGMGVVYKAYDALMEREVAIKVISDGVLALPEIKSRFYREARTAGKLSHENITVIYDVSEDEGRPYIVMEYLAGADLGAILDRSEPLPLQQKLEYAIQICRGLAFSHSRGIIHRDIKPGNIRITGDGKVKIMDFGIAKPESSNLTRTGALIGTPFYMSPEQIQGKKVDTRSDIFSFGVLFFELLTGKKPFPGSEPTSVMYKIVHEEPEQIDEHLIDRRTGLRDIVLKTLEKDPDRRYQDLSEVADALGHILAEMRSADRKKVLELKQKIDRLIAESRAFLSAGKFKKALETAERAAKFDPANTEIGRLSIEIRKAEEEAARKAFVESRLQDARRGYAAKKYENVIALTKQILESDPNNTEAQRLNRQAQDAITYAKTGEEQYAETMLAGPVAGKRREEQPAPQRKPTPPPQPVELPKKTPPSPARRKTLAIVAVVVLLAGLGISYRLFLYTPPVPTGFVMLNVRPWAQVTRVVGPGDTELPIDQNTMTPCRLALPAGSYTIHLANPAFGKPIVVTVDVKDAQMHEVKEKFAGFDIEQAVAKFQ